MKADVSGISLGKVKEAFENVRRNELVFARVGESVFVEIYA